MAFTLNKLIFHRRTGKNSGNKLPEMLGTTGEHILGFCSFILVLYQLSCGCEGKRDGPGDKERRGSHCARHPLARCETCTGGAATGATWCYMG